MGNVLREDFKTVFLFLVMVFGLAVIAATVHSWSNLYNNSLTV